MRKLIKKSEFRKLRTIYIGNECYIPVVDVICMLDKYIHIPDDLIGIAEVLNYEYQEGSESIGGYLVECIDEKDLESLLLQKLNTFEAITAYEWLYSEIFPKINKNIFEPTKTVQATWFYRHNKYEGSYTLNSKSPHLIQ